MKRAIYWFIFVSLISSQAFAEGALEDEIKGFTTDNTITRIGHDFARYLGDYRTSNIPSSEYNLSVYERPSARWGNLIWVEHDHKTVYRNFLSPSSAELKQTAEQAAIEIHKKIKRIKLEALFQDTFDLERDEL